MRDVILVEEIVEAVPLTTAGVRDDAQTRKLPVPPQTLPPHDERAHNRLAHARQFGECPSQLRPRELPGDFRFLRLAARAGEAWRCPLSIATSPMKSRGPPVARISSWPSRDSKASNSSPLKITVIPRSAYVTNGIIGSINSSKLSAFGIAPDKFPVEMRVAWQTPGKAEFSSTNGAEAEFLSDGSFRAGGKIPDKDTYTIRFEVGNQRVTHVQLEAIPDEKIGKGGPGNSDSGNFVLNELEMEVQEAGSGTEPRQMKFAGAQAEYSQEGYPEENAIDGKGDTGWAIGGTEARSTAMPSLCLGRTVGLEKSLARHDSARSKLRHPSHVGTIPRQLWPGVAGQLAHGTAPPRIARPEM